MPDKKTAPPEIVALFDKLVDAVPEIDRKGANMPYTSINGNMFSCLHPSGLLSLRLAPADREAFLAKYNTTLFEAYGIVQKEYVTVTPELLANTEELKPYLEASFAYAKSLKPKPSKKGNT